MRRSWFHPSRGGFTLVELLVVIAIIGILVALLLPAVQAAREAGRRSQCSNNLKQLGLSVHNFHDTYKVSPPSSFGQEGRASWAVLILPFIEQQPLYNQFGDITQDLRSTGGNNPLGICTSDAACGIQGFSCPTRRAGIQKGGVNDGGGSGVTGGPGPASDYAVAVWKEGSGHADWWNHIQAGTDPNILKIMHGMLVSTRSVPNVANWNWKSQCTVGFGNVTDGLSNTICIGEKCLRTGELNRCCSGGSPYYQDGGVFFDTGNWGEYSIGRSAHNLRMCNGSSPALNVGAPAYDFGFGSWHPGICQFVMGDGAVRQVSNTISQITLDSLGSRDDGVPVTDF